jgi:hypothetical protein
MAETHCAQIKALLTPDQAADLVLYLERTDVHYTLEWEHDESDSLAPLKTRKTYRVLPPARALTPEQSAAIRPAEYQRSELPREGRSLSGEW